MKMPSFVHSAMTIGLLVACVHFANQLDAERGRSAAQAHQRELLETRIQMLFTSTTTAAWCTCPCQLTAVGLNWAARRPTTGSAARACAEVAWE